MDHLHSSTFRHSFVGWRLIHCCCPPATPQHVCESLWKHALVSMYKDSERARTHTRTQAERERERDRERYPFYDFVFYRQSGDSFSEVYFLIKDTCSDTSLAATFCYTARPQRIGTPHALRDSWPSCQKQPQRQ